MPYNYVTCKNVMSRRIVMVTRGVMYDIGLYAPRGSPLIGVERRGFPPRQESLVAGGAAAVWRQLDSGFETRSTTRNIRVIK